MSDPAVGRDGLRYERGSDPALDAALDQLVESGLAQVADDGEVELPWSAVYAALADDLDFGLRAADLRLPPVADDVVVDVAHEGSLTNTEFSVRVDAVRRGTASVRARPVHVGTPWFTDGSTEFLLTSDTYVLMELIAAARQREPFERTPDANRRLLAQVRNAAAVAQANLDVYLQRTRVLLPEELLLALEQTQTPAGQVITVVPRFDGEPDRWLEAFDSRRAVPDVYSVPEGREHCEIVVSHEVRGALSAIKQLPGRRVAGAAAQRLVSNPYAYFGPEVAVVFNEKNVEQVVAELRHNTCRFLPQIDADRPSETALLIEPVDETADLPSTVEAFTRHEMVRAFCRVASGAVREAVETFEWRGHELLVDGDTPSSIDLLLEIAEAWSDAERAADDRTSEDPVDVPEVDLALYSDRVEAIGIETPYAILVIPRPKQLGAWFPDEIAVSYKPTAAPAGQPISLTAEQVQALPRLIEEASNDGHGSVSVPGMPAPISLAVAQDIVQHAPTVVIRSAASGRPIGATPPRGACRQRHALLIGSNIDNEDYVESRAERLMVPEDACPVHPLSLRENVGLKQHQEHGVAWLQHLISLGADQCRGALLADDMGLGKTLQLLTVALSHLERVPGAGPVLVVAPVTLLENWQAELQRFFDVENGQVLALYGEHIRRHRAGPQDVDPGLFATGRKLLRDDWLGSARLVLTTYETVRDLEFSLAELDWSIVICDEAQRIKNPNALISRAVKKLKADFRIAATGTPVENSLRDIWSIFDFIQPGLLAPLNRFGREYQRPIEARTERQRGQLENLRRILQPQILRRTKQDVAQDLPAKLFDGRCRNLPMSEFQRDLYVRAIAAARSQEHQSAQERALSTLNVLRYLRRICCDPRPEGESASADLPVTEYCARSPKFEWLIQTLRVIRERGEKAIVFLESKDVQRQLKLYLDAAFDLNISIVNGETSAVAGSNSSRQGLIDRYQARPGFAVIILSPLAAGVGLNIQAANHVIHYMRHWNPAREDQATDRAYRIGQEREVHVYTPIVLGPGWPSFDERLDELLEFKRGLAADMYNGADDVTASELESVLGAV